MGVCGGVPPLPKQQPLLPKQPSSSKPGNGLGRSGCFATATLELGEEVKKLLHVIPAACWHHTATSSPPAKPRAAGLQAWPRQCLGGGGEKELLHAILASSWYHTVASPPPKALKLLFLHGEQGCVTSP